MRLSPKRSMQKFIIGQARVLTITIYGRVAAYVTVLLGLLFVQGMKIVIQDGVDHRKAIVVGLSFWFGTAFQNKWVFPDLLGEGFLGVLLGNGMTSGALVAIAMMVFMELTSTRRRRMEAALDIAALPKLEEFLLGLASKAGWNSASTERLVLVGEETLSSLLSEKDDELPGSEARRLAVIARTKGSGAELEFLSAHEGETPDIRDGREISFRLLRHYASSVRHQKYHGVDVVTVSIEGPR